MPELLPTRFRIRKIIVLTLLVFLFIYIVYNIFSGERGLINMSKLKERHEGLEQEISALQKQKDTQQKQVRQMQGKSLDLDLLDEQARKNLGVAGGDETIYVDK